MNIEGSSRLLLVSSASGAVFSVALLLYGLPNLTFLNVPGWGLGAPPNLPVIDPLTSPKLAATAFVSDSAASATVAKAQFLKRLDDVRNDIRNSKGNDALVEIGRLEKSLDASFAAIQPNSGVGRSAKACPGSVGSPKKLATLSNIPPVQKPDPTNALYVVSVCSACVTGIFSSLLGIAGLVLAIKDHKMKAEKHRIELKGRDET